jgi:hypothetical protein
MRSFHGVVLVVACSDYSKVFALNEVFCGFFQPKQSGQAAGASPYRKADFAQSAERM